MTVRYPVSKAVAADLYRGIGFRACVSMVFNYIDKYVPLLTTVLKLMEVGWISTF
jgi:hypothetical protein